MNVGDIFYLNLAPMFCDGFHEGYRGTPDYGRVPTKYGCIYFWTDSPLDVPGAGGIDYYDWRDNETGRRLAVDETVLELKIIRIDEYDDIIEGELVGWVGMPTVKLTFQEFDEYAELA